MTNLRKCLSVSAFAFIALALCCLVIGQAVVAKVQTGVNAANSGNAIAFDRNIPLPQVDLRGAPDQAAQAEEPGVEPTESVMYDPLDHLIPLKEPKKGYVNKTGGTFAGGDGPGDATVITALPYHDEDTNVGASDLVEVDCGYGAPSSIGVYAGDVWYSYTPTTNEWINISLCNSLYDGGVGAYDFMLIVYEDDYTLGAINCDDDYCATYGASEIPSMAVIAGHTYYIVVDGWAENDFVLDVTTTADPYADACAAASYNEVETCGAHTNDGCWLYSTGVPLPSELEQVNNNELICGTTYQAGTTTGVDRDGDVFRFTLTTDRIVTVSAMFELETRFFLYQDPLTICNTLATGGFNATIPQDVPFTWTGALPAGSYAVANRANTQAGDCGTGRFATDNRFFIEIASRDIVPYDDCEGAVAINGDGSWNFDNTGYMYDLNADNAMWADLYFLWTPDIDGLAQINTCSSTGIDDTQIAIYPEGCPATGTIAYNDDAGCGASGYLSELTNVVVLSSNTYLIQIGSYYGDEGAGTLTISTAPLPPQLGQTCGDPIDLGTGDQHEFFYNTTATTDGPTVNSYCYDPNDGSTVGADLWYLWTASANGPVTAGFCDGNFDGRMEVYEGSACPGLVTPRKPVACDDDGCIDEWEAPSIVDWEATAGTQYLIRLGSWEDPTHPAVGGLGYLDITEGAAIAHPVNDWCEDATALSVTLAGLPLGESDEVAAIGSLEHAMYYDCPYAQDGGSTIWYSITFDVCAYVAIYYCGSTATEYNPYHTQTVWNGCPCTPNEGVQILEDNAFVVVCGNYSTYHEFNLLPPGTYYIPVTRGVGGWGTGKPDVQINIYVEAVECQYCEAFGNTLSCPASGSTWIQGMAFREGIDTLVWRGYGSNTHLEECNGYSDFKDSTAYVPTVYEGKTYLVLANAGRNGSILTADDIMVAYFDWSQDASFYENTPPEAYPMTRVGQNYQTTVTIPFGIGGPFGKTAMRLRISKASVAPNTPCGESTWGEVEDYMLDVRTVPCGDFDDNGVIEMADVAVLKDLYFNPAAAAPALWEMADATGDCVFNIADVVYLADYVWGRVTTLECFPCTPL